MRRPRVETGIVVRDLDKAFEATQTRKVWTIAAGIARHSWGVRDFRVDSPERYYVRITERCGFRRNPATLLRHRSVGRMPIGKRACQFDSLAFAQDLHLNRV